MLWIQFPHVASTKNSERGDTTRKKERHTHCFVRPHTEMISARVPDEIDFFDIFDDFSLISVECDVETKDERKDST